MSKRAMEVAIISIAQQASPNCNGHTEFLRPQLYMSCNVVVNTLQFACSGTGSVPELDGHGGLTLRSAAPEREYPTPLGEGVIVSVAPWFHAMGTVGYLNSQFMTGTTIVSHPRLDVPAFLADMERFRATALGGFPQPNPDLPKQLDRLFSAARVAADIESMRTICAGCRLRMPTASAQRSQSSRRASCTSSVCALRSS